MMKRGANRKERCQQSLQLYEKYKDILVVQRFLGHKHIRTTLNYLMAKRNLNKPEEL